jgi:hypothetical protein
MLPMKKNRLIVLFALVAALCGTFMLMIGPEKTLDVRLFYSQEEAYDWLSTLTSNQRAYYIVNEFLDIVYTISYSMIFFLVLGPMGLIPGILDLIETVPIILHLQTGSELPSQLGIVSGFKWITGVITVILVIRKFMAGRKNTRGSGPR